MWWGIEPFALQGGALAVVNHPITGRLPSEVAEDKVFQPPAIETLFHRHSDDVFRIVASLLGPGASRADVQDLTQQVFLTAHRALPRFRGDSAPLTWLYGIASKTVLVWLRGRRRHKRMLETLEAEPTPTPRSNVEETVIQRDQLRRVWCCLMRIKPKKRIVYIMFEVEGLSGKEIAEALNIKEATVRTRVLHARRELAKELRKTRRKEEIHGV